MQRELGVRKTGIEAMIEAPWGAHLCLLYETQQELLEVLVPYFKAGLENDEACLWLTAPPLEVHAAWEALAQAIPELDAYRRRGRIEILPHTEYLERGRFSQERAVEAWTGKREDALARGCAGLRLAGSAFGLGTDDRQGVAAYEAALGRLIGHDRTLVLCAYALDRCSPLEVASAIKHHPFALFKRDGTWEAIEGVDRRRAQTSEGRLDLQRAQAIAQTGSWWLDVHRNQLLWSDETCRMFGLPKGTVTTYEAFLAYVHPEDREYVDRRWKAALRGTAPYEVEHRIVVGGAVKWVRERAELDFDSDGALLGGFGTVQDITERKRVEAALREQEFRTLAENSPDIIARFDKELRHVYVNHALEAATGLPRAAFIGNTLDMVLPEQTVLFCEAQLRSVFQSGENKTAHFTYESPYGPRHHEWHVAPEFGPDGRVESVLVIARDITERERAEKEQGHLAAIVESSDVAILSKALDGTILSWNAGAQHIYGYAADEVKGRSVSILAAPDHVDEIPQCLERIRHGERIEHFETQRVRKDGTLVDVALSISPIQDATGKVIGASTIAYDITERKRAEAALLRLSHQNRLILESAGEGIYGVDSNGVFTFINPAAAQMLGYTVEELIGRPAHDVLHHSRADGAPYPLSVCPIHSSYRQGTTHRIADEVFWRKDGSSFPVEYLSTAVLEQDRVVGAVISFLDITERKRAEGERERLLSQIAEADQRKDEFLATLAHELRNPLAPVANAFALIRRAAGAPELIEQALGIGERQVGQLARLVDDLLDVSRISRGKITLRKARVSLHGVVQSALETARPRIEAAGHWLTVELPEEPVCLKADRTRLAQALSNLLINAAKFTEPGGHIRLRAHCEGEEVAIAVQDNGIGIPAEQLHKVFGLFAQIEQPSGRRRGGLGIGLALVKSLVELHGGQVEAASPGAGQGSTFTMLLPVVVPSRPPPKLQDKEKGAQAPATMRRILVVDDEADVADSMAMLLKTCGHEVVTAYDGATAIEAARTHWPEVVLLDVGMPGMDGLEVARRLREVPELLGVRLIALTGWGQEADRRRSHAAGFDAHLVKPVDLRTLEALLEGERSAAGEQAAG
jgi:PAS domain S-box-containing protein